MVTPESRFFAKVERRGGDECWPWVGGSHLLGYGRFWLDRRMVSATHFAYEHFVGPVPKGMDVLHHCDNPPCVNPGHLFLGDQRANGRDMAAKGRSAKGENHGMAKLTADDVRGMRARYTGKRGEATQLAYEYGITPANVGYILRRETWTHV